MCLNDAPHPRLRWLFIEESAAAPGPECNQTRCKDRIAGSSIGAPDCALLKLMLSIRPSKSSHRRSAHGGSIKNLWRGDIFFFLLCALYWLDSCTIITFTTIPVQTVIGRVGEMAVVRPKTGATPSWLARGRSKRPALLDPAQLCLPRRRRVRSAPGGPEHAPFAGARARAVMGPMRTRTRRFTSYSPTLQSILWICRFIPG